MYQLSLTMEILDDKHTVFSDVKQVMYFCWQVYQLTGWFWWSGLVSTGWLGWFADLVWAASYMGDITCLSFCPASYSGLFWQRKRTKRKNRSIQSSWGLSLENWCSVTSISFCWPKQGTRLTQIRGMGTPPSMRGAAKSLWKGVGYMEGRDWGPFLQWVCHREGANKEVSHQFLSKMISFATLTSK